jgi:hypothetical protein
MVTLIADEDPALFNHTWHMTAICNAAFLLACSLQFRQL